MSPVASLVRVLPALLIAAVAGGCASKKAAVKPTAGLTPAAISAPARTVAAEPLPVAATEEDLLAEAEPAKPLPPLEFPVVGFEFDSDLLTAEGRGALDSFAGAWRAHDKANSLVIAGHADERGPEEYNILLGQKRASAVRRYLSDLGLPEKALRTVSYGENRPLDATDSETAFARNRRAEVTVQ